MDKKKLVKIIPAEDMKGFEEFLEGQPEDSTFLPRPAVSGNKKETSFEHFTYLSTDGERLLKLKNLLSDKLPFSAKFEQGNALLKQQREEIDLLKTKIFNISDAPDSPYRKSLKEIFDSFFDPPQD